MTVMIFTDKPPCLSDVMSDARSAPLDAGLSFNMVPSGGPVPTVPSQPAAVLPVPIQDQEEQPTQPQIPLHDKHPENDKAKLELQPNRDQVYHLRGSSKLNSQLLFLPLLRCCCYVGFLKNVKIITSVEVDVGWRSFSLVPYLLHSLVRFGPAMQREEGSN